jgi:cobalt-zinc-cadmium resistance protein CzcA
VRGRDLDGAVEESIAKVNAGIHLPRGYHINWEGEYQSSKRAAARLLIIIPLTVLLIFIILYMMFRSFKWASLILVNVLLARVGGFLALLVSRAD